MSYTIEYDRQFIKSGFGYTPAWCAGDNNVYVTDKKRERSWCLFHNLVGVTQQQIEAAVQNSLNGYQQHWKKNGKWLDDAALLRWIRNGCKQAATIEEILEINPFNHIYCELVYYDDQDKRQQKLNQYVKSTIEFDTWIADVKEFTEQLRASGLTCIYPIVSFPREKIAHPSVMTKEGKYAIKNGSMYLSAFSDRGYSLTSKMAQALTFNYAEAVNALKVSGLINQNAVRIVKAKSLDKPYNAVIRCADGPYPGQYIFAVSSTRVRLTHNPNNAKKYADEKSAQRAIKSAITRFSRIGTLEVVTL